MRLAKPTTTRSHVAGKRHPITFHIGFQVSTKKSSVERRAQAMADPVEGAKQSALLFAGNMNGIAEVIMGGICARFPGLKFVSVESGYGYVPFLLEALDWQFRNSAARSRHCPQGTAARGARAPQ